MPDSHFGPAHGCIHTSTYTLIQIYKTLTQILLKKKFIK